MKKYLLLFCLFPLFLHSQTNLDNLELKDIFYEPLLAGTRPDFARFSIDEKAIYFYGNDSAFAEKKLYKVSLDEKNTIDVDKDDFIRNFTYSADGSKLLFTKKNAIYIADSDLSNPRKIISTSGFKQGVKWAPDSLKFSYIQDGNVMVMNLESSQLRQLTEKKKDVPGYRIIDWAGDKALIVEQFDNSTAKAVYFPEYLGEKVNPGRSVRGFGKRTISVVSMDTDTIAELYSGMDFCRVATSASGRYVALNCTDTPMKRHYIDIADLKTTESRQVFSDSTEGWIYYTDMRFAPDSDILMFHSERDGWNHLYTVNADGSDFRQITNGAYEVPWAEWLDDRNIIFASTEEDPGERHLRKLNLKSGKTTKLTSREGYRKAFHLSRDKNTVVYEFSYFNEPGDLYAIQVNVAGKEQRLTHSTPELFQEISWQTPDYIRFIGHDGETELSMTVLKPEIVDPSVKNPVVVFVHGAGSLQNVYKGWSTNYWREYMFHQILAARGYYVIEVDYRHSLGYGRDFREKVTGWMGKYETEDIIDGLEYLSKHYPLVNRNKVGIYGGSYGGFMALYAVSTAPDCFHAAAALRAVTNWENYYEANPWYTLPRLGTPEQDSTNYAQSSPLTYAENLERPVLILHGLIDNNVPYRDAAQYIQKLIEAGNKDFDFMMYPGERHSFVSPDAWYDEYVRIYKFFERELK